MRRSDCRSTAHRQRRGSIAFEMIMVLVVIIIVTVGIVQFGVFLANAEQVAMAARVGALEASQTDPLLAGPGPVPLNIIQAIEHQLESSCIDWCQIRVEHNVGGGVSFLVSNAIPADDCECDPKMNLLGAPGSGIAASRYVRVTVCVPLSQVMPKQLSFFGEQIYDPDNTYEHTAIYRYEIGTP
jgi:hypothetical protein